MTKKAALFITLPVLIISFLISPVFGQGPGKWGSWQKANCYSGISFSVVNMGFGKNAGGYLWGIRFRNDYDIPVTFSYKLTIGEEYKGELGFDVTKTLKTGEIWTDGEDFFTAKLFKSPSTKYFYRIKSVCFNKPNCDKKCYADCDLVGGEANQQADCAGNSSIQNGTQKDLAENNYTDKKVNNSGFSNMEEEVIAIADYICQMMKFEEMYKEKEPDEAAIKKYSELKDKGGVLIEAFEKKYTSEKDLALYKSIYEREMGKCKTKPSSNIAAETDIAVLNGEWNSGDGLLTVITKTRGNGFDFWKKDDVANKDYYKYISANEYGYTSPSGTKRVLKMTNSNRLEAFKNGQHFGYFFRSASSPNETEQSAKNTSRIEEGEWVCEDDAGLIITLKFSTDGLHWSQKNPDSEIVLFKIAPGTYRYGSDDASCIIIKFINSNRFSFSYAPRDSLFYYNRVSSIVNENKPTTAVSAFEADIKKLADYDCKMRVNEVKSDPNDKKAREEYWKIFKEATNFRTILEDRYTIEVVGSEAARKITLEEWKKCPVKVIIY